MGADRLTINPFAILRAQESNNTADIDGQAHTAQRAEIGETLIKLLFGRGGVRARGVAPSVLGVHVSLDATRGDGIDSDFLGATVGREAAGEALDSSLAASVQGMVLDTLHRSGDRRHEDDAAVVRTVVVAGLGDEELGTGVEGKDVVVLLRGDLAARVESFPARVGDNKVDAAEGGFGLVEHCSDLLGLGDVSLDGNGLPAQSLDLLDDLLGTPSAAGVVDDNVSSTPRKLQGNACANAAAGTGD